MRNDINLLSLPTIKVRYREFRSQRLPCFQIRGKAVNEYSDSFPRRHEFQPSKNFHSCYLLSPKVPDFLIASYRDPACRGKTHICDHDKQRVSFAFKVHDNFGELRDALTIVLIGPGPSHHRSGFRRLGNAGISFPSFIF